MKKRYARAKPIKKENEDKDKDNVEPTIIKLDTFTLSVLIGTLITGLIILIPILIRFIETFL